ncbi:flavodoxin family protein [Planococcus sp. X10-3]|uniref:flavodoxin family protein n=1 Tax=Planococcus sp. X10-3 TaxID=3061240 RepID=UPI003BB02D7C
MKNSSLIVYYSWIGSTEVVAKEIQRLTGFDIQRIEEKKKRTPGKIAGAAMGAFLGFKSSLKPMDFALEEYENIFLGGQVWAGKTPPAINQYLKKASFKDKKVWLFLTKGDEKVPQQVIDSITKRIEKKGGKVVDSISITTKWDPKVNLPIALEEVQEPIYNWLKKGSFIKVS